MTIEQWRSRIVRHADAAPASLKAHPQNWRAHPQEQREALIQTLDEVGWVQDVIVNETTGHVIDGHLRIELAIERGEASVPVVYVELTPEEELLVLATLDPLASMAEPDTAALSALLDDILMPEGALGDLLVDLAKDAGIVQPVEGKTDPDEVPEQRETDVQRGQVYQLGAHRLMCGDATAEADVARLLAGEQIHSMITDPPYGIDHEGIANDAPDTIGELYAQMLVTTPLVDAVIAAFHSPRMFPVWLDAARAEGLTFERMLWLHRAAAKTFPWRGWVMASDPILLMSLGSPAWPEPDEWCHDTYEKTTLEDSALTGSHPTIKPVAVVEDLVRKLPQSGPVYDPFVGSGTTLIAAEHDGRACYAMEISEQYVQVSIDRWEAYTGETAVLLDDGTGR